MLKCFLLASIALVVAADNWALLVAGSNGYYNYRHQADVCHSYQILKANGFSDDRIITMFYDDIARSPSNPVKDNLINQPNGPNVYTGCKKDYTGGLVTPQNFLKVLSGQPMSVGSGKTLETNENDNIFVFFSDHGATGILAFPTSELHALDLNNTITTMFQQKKYRQMLIYIEACEAGSMFHKILSPSVNVLAVTASDPTHSSYAIYYDSTRQTYLGDVFSVYWMQDSEKHTSGETIQQQYDIVKTLTTTSAVCQYGDLTIDPELLSLFQSPPSKMDVGQFQSPPLVSGEVMDSRDINIAVLRHQLEAATPADRSRISDLLSGALLRRQQADERMQSISQAAATLLGRPVDFISRVDTDEDICYPNSAIVQNPTCLREMVGAFKKVCGAFDDYSLKYVRVLNAICNAGIAPVDLQLSMAHACSA